MTSPMRNLSVSIKYIAHETGVCLLRSPERNVNSDGTNSTNIQLCAAPFLKPWTSYNLVRKHILSVTPWLTKALGTLSSIWFDQAHCCSSVQLWPLLAPPSWSFSRRSLDQCSLCTSLVFHCGSPHQGLWNSIFQWGFSLPFQLRWEEVHPILSLNLGCWQPYHIGWFW